MTRVWDLPLRLFHWAMVVAVVVAAITGFLTPEWWLDLHSVAGYALGVLLAFRLVWGVFGSPYSRFRSFPLKLSDLHQHLISVLHRTPRIFVGHNPAGAWMIVVLLFLLVALVITGVLALGGRENLGPLAFVTVYQIGNISREVHEIAALGLLWAVAIHLLGVFVDTRIFKHPVLAVMMIGNKMSSDKRANGPDGTHTARGAVWFASITGLLIVVGVAMASVTPSGWRNIQTPADYVAECGDCHDAYHPSLRTAAAWRSVMNGLENHYGEDASLDEGTIADIRAYLVENHAGTFDTEVANRIGRIDTPSFRMTDVRRWKKQHRDINESVYRLKSVGSKVNCQGCHKDAESGRFDDDKIHLPSGDKS